jgi:hypothetical protein
MWRKPVERRDPDLTPDDDLGGLLLQVERAAAAQVLERESARIESGR